jgi:mannose-1-phosphate guanylyltransferase/mannose-6-phosphate isomerase
MRIIPVLLAGGIGSRLWPLSREQFPKQCINLIDTKKSLIQQTAERVVKAGLTEQPIVICNNDHRFMIAQQLSDSKVASNIILEPEGRNTAPALAIASWQAIKRDPSSIIVALPADHVISDGKYFNLALRSAIFQAKKNKIVTFGIRPTYPETGYGYIKAGTLLDDNGGLHTSYNIDAFKEKPKQALAEEYINSGSYFWNSGMFVFSAQLYLDELEKLEPQIFNAVKASFEALEVDLDFIRVGAKEFSSSPSNSIDYAVLEHTDKAVMVPYEGDWSDVGVWSALYDINNKDESGNVHQGDVLTHDSHNNYVRTDSQLVATVGVDNLAIIATKDAIAIMHRDKAQDIKHIVNQLNEQGRSEHIIHTKVYRPWGSYQRIDQGERHQVKRILVKPNEKLSLQMHYHRAEHWVVVSGTAKVTIGDKVKLLSENESIYIPIGETHALENPGKIPLEIIEVQTGSYLDEDDIVRFEDRYGR